MTACENCQVQLSAFIDGQLPPGERAEVAGHLAGCEACQAVARDLERVRTAARQLGPLDPPDHVWLEVAGQIRLMSPQTLFANVRPTPRRAGLRPFIGLAAALVLITIGVYLVGLLRTPAAGTAPGNAPAQTSVQSVADELSMALEHYDKAIAQLQTLAGDKDSGLDPALTATLQKNLTVIDQAIVESRTALTTDPQSEPARATLMDALRQKVGLLQTTVALMNEMRKGNQDGAAAVVSGRKS